MMNPQNEGNSALTSIVNKATKEAEKYNCKHSISQFKCGPCTNKTCEHGIRRFICSRCHGEEGVARMLFSKAKYRAKKRQMSFTLTLQDVYDLVIKTGGICPVLGFSLKMGGGATDGLRDHAPSIDRHKNSEGYHKNNCFVISLMANRLKSNASAEQLKRVAEYAERGI